MINHDLVGWLVGLENPGRPCRIHSLEARDMAFRVWRRVVRPTWWLEGERGQG